MAGTSGNGNSFPSQTKDCFQKYIDDYLTKDKEAAENEEKVGCINFRNKNKVRAYLICCLLKAHKTVEEYNGLHNCVETPYAAYTKQIEENIKHYLSIDEAIAKSLESSITALKASKDKLWKVREMACRLDAARKDSCNSQQIKAIDKGLEEEDRTGKEVFDEKVDEIIGKANQLFDDGDALFEKGVKIAGVLAFRNTTSIEELSQQLNGKVKELTKNIAGNMEFAKTATDEAQEAYTVGLQELIQTEVFKYNGHIKTESLIRMETTTAGLKELDCETDFDKAMLTAQLKSICDEVMDTSIGDLC